MSHDSYNKNRIRTILISALVGLIVSGFFVIGTSTQKTIIDPSLPGKTIIDPTLPGKTIITAEPIVDPPPEPEEFCTTEDDKNSTTTINGDVVYCDNNLLTWTPTLDLPADTEAAERYEWGCRGTAVGADSNTNGRYNTDQILHDGTTCASRPIAASMCDNLSHADKNDWYLPAKDTLYSFWTGPCGESSCDSSNVTWDDNAEDGFYWSSTEDSSLKAFYVYFYNGSVGSDFKDFYIWVRCVRGQ